MKNTLWPRNRMISFLVPPFYKVLWYLKSSSEVKVFTLSGRYKMIWTAPLFFLCCCMDFRKLGGCFTTQNDGISFWLPNCGAFFMYWLQRSMASSLNQEKGSLPLWWAGAGSQTQAWDVCVCACVSGEVGEARLYPDTLWWAGTVVKRAGSGVRPRGFKSELSVTLGKLPSSHFPHP